MGVLQQINTIQIEIDRGIYLDEAQVTPSDQRGDPRKIASGV